MPDHSFMSSRAPDPVGPYPHARRVGGLLFLSGVGPRTAGSHEIPGLVLDEEGQVASYDFEKQCHSVIQNVQAIVEEAGSSLAQIVDVTVFLVDMKNDFATMNEVYRQYFSEHKPCRTTVEVSDLPTTIAIELKCIATIGD